MSLDDDFAADAQDRTGLLRQHFAAAVTELVDGDDADVRLPASKSFVQQLTEVAWSWTTTALAPDLESFARHAKRSKVGAEDVLLAARKNEGTHALLESAAAGLKAEGAGGKRKAAADPPPP